MKDNRRAQMLLLDWGNTRLKWGELAEGDMRPGGAVAHEDNVRAALGEISVSPDAVWIGSVGGASLDKALRQAIVERWPEASVHFARTEARAHGVVCAYDDPSAMGVDRWLAMIAARSLVDGAFTVLDAGSAVTLDAVDTDGQHLGGLIVPGAGMARRLLRERTGRVRVSGESQRTWWADNTRDAVDSGVRLAAVALAERFHEQTARRLRREPTMVLTGGDAPAMMDLLSVPCDHVPELVLQGLAIVADAMVPAR